MRVAKSGATFEEEGAAPDSDGVMDGEALGKAPTGDFGALNAAAPKGTPVPAAPG